MITCRELIDFLMSYLDGELPEAARAEFDAHLNACRACCAYMETYKAAVRLSKSAMDAPVPPAPEELVRAVLAARAKME